MSGEPFHRCTHTAVSPETISTSPTATAMRASTNTRRKAGCSSRGASRASILASSTSRTTSAATRTAGSMWPTAKITASRSLTATGNTRRRSTISTARARCSSRRAAARSAISARSGPNSASIASGPISARASASRRTRESCWRASPASAVSPEQARPVPLPARPRRRFQGQPLCRRGRHARLAVALSRRADPGRPRPHAPPDEDRVGVR